MASVNSTPGRRRAYQAAWRAARGEQHRKYQREWKARHPETREQSKLRMQRLRAADPDHFRNYIRARGGLPLPVRAEPAVCDCCGQPPREKQRSLCLDHDHVTGRFRGWLCGRCNRSIGQLGDSVEGLMRAVRYLQTAELI